MSCAVKMSEIDSDLSNDFSGREVNEDSESDEESDDCESMVDDVSASQYVAIPYPGRSAYMLKNQSI